MVRIFKKYRRKDEWSQRGCSLSQSVAAIKLIPNKEEKTGWQ
jgi:hypothetical protein